MNRFRSCVWAAAWLRTAGFAAVCAVAVSGCSSVTYDLQRTWQLYFQGQEDIVLSAEEIEVFPYTVQYARLGSRGQATIVLGYIDPVGSGYEYHWVSADQETLVTENGRVKRVSRMGDYRILATYSGSADPIGDMVRSGVGEAAWQRTVDYTVNGESYSVVAASQFVANGPQSLELPAGVVNVYHVVERGQFVGVAGSTGKFVNEFWVEADGHVVKSRQTLAPGADELQLTQVKWVGR